MIIKHKFLNREFHFPTWEIDTLVLGTFNPECGEDTDYYYGRTKNNFWRAVEGITGIEHKYLLNNLPGKLEVMQKYKFGCTDVIASVEFNEDYKENVCGNGYADSKIFALRTVTASYQFDRIKDFLIDNKVKNVINTWGKRNSPKIFKKQVNDLKAFCELNNIKFTANCPSPSPRSRNSIEKLKDFYKQNLINY